MGGADAFDAERQGFQSQIYLLKSEKETLERSVYSVSGELGQVKVELSMLKSRRDSEQTGSARKVSSLEAQLGSARLKEKAADEANAAMRAKADKADEAAGAAAVAAAAMRRELGEAHARSHALGAELEALRSQTEEYAMFGSFVELHSPGASRHPSASN